MTAPAKESLSRWLPTVVAILAILGQVFWFGQRTGTIEANVKVLSDNQSIMFGQIREMVPRMEYAAQQTSTAVQIQDVKQSLRDANNKLDQLIMRVQ